MVTPSAGIFCWEFLRSSSRVEHSKMELEAAIFSSKLREAEDTRQLRRNHNDPANITCY